MEVQEIMWKINLVRYQPRTTKEWKGNSEEQPNFLLMLPMLG